MAKNFIKGIVVEIGGDTSGLQKSLKEANSAISSLSKELKEVNSLLKLDPKNTDLLAQKQTILKDKINATKQSLDSLKEAQQRYIQSGGDLNSQEYRTLQREILKTEQELQKLNVEASKFTQIGNNLNNLSEKFKSIGSTVENVGKKISIASTAVATFFGLGTKYNADLEKTTVALETMLGSAEEANKMINTIKEQSKISPFDTKTIIQANRYLLASDISAENAMNTIYSLADAIALTGGGNDELDRMAYNLSQISNNGKATAVDIKQFGNAGIPIMKLISEATGLTLEELDKMPITYDLISKGLEHASSESGRYYQGQVKLSNTLSGQISKLKKTFQELAGELSEGLYPIIKKITASIQGLIDKIKDLDPRQKEIIVKIGLIVTALGPALIIIGKLITYGGQIFGVLSKVSKAFAGFSSGAGIASKALTALTSPVGLVIAGIVALAGAFIYFFKTNDEFREKVISVWNDVVKTFQEQVMPVIQNLWTLLKQTIENIMKILQEVWEKIQPILLTIFTWVLDNWEGTFKQVITNAIDFVAKLIELALKIYNEFVLPIISFLLEDLWPSIEWVFNNVWNVVQTVSSFISNMTADIMGILGGLIDFISGVFSADWERAWQGVQDIFSNIMGALWEILKLPLNMIIDGLNALIDGINKIQIPDWVPAVGGYGINIPNIPRLAKGGIIDQATIAMIGEGNASEAVIPLDRTLTKYLAEALKSAGSSNQIVVNFYPQKMTNAELDNAFNYLNRKFGLQY